MNPIRQTPSPIPRARPCALLSALLGLFLALGFAGLAGCAFTGCATQQSPRAKVFLTFEAIQISVHEAMNLYGEIFRADQLKPQPERKLSPGTIAAIREAHRKYRIAFTAGISAAQFNYASPAPADVQRLKDELLALIIPLF